MKRILAACCFALASLAVNAQDCSKYIETTTDKVTGKTSTTSTFLYLEDAERESKMLIYSRLYNKYNLYLAFRLDGVSGCMDVGNKIYILFKDGSRMELANMSAFNCDGRGDVLFAKMSPLMKHLRELQTKDIDVIRVHSTKSYFEATFTPEQAEQFRQGLTCLMPPKK